MEHRVLPVDPPGARVVPFGIDLVTEVGEPDAATTMVTTRPTTDLTGTKDNPTGVDPDEQGIDPDPQGID